MTTKPDACPQCGKPKPANAPEGLCPACVARLSFGLVTEEPPGSPSECSKESVGTTSSFPAPMGIGATKPAAFALFGEYELLGEIGRGGMGVVYRARQKRLNRMVALKMIPFGPLAAEDVVRRFHAEAEAAAHLQHPNIVTIYEIGEQDGQHFFSMELVEGGTLGDLLRKGPLPSRRAAVYLQTIALAVQHAHERGILHRDLKPSNILIDTHDQPRVTDFGLAKRLSGDSTLTLSGQLLGSPNYMPPEQASAKRGELTVRSDVYSIGAMLYHTLTGRPPFQAESVEVVLSQVASQEPASVRLLNPAVPRDLETIALKCLSKEPPRRYSSAQQLAEELERFLRDEPILAKPAGQAEKVWRWCRRKPALATTLALLHLVLFAGAAGVLWQWWRAEATAAALRKDVYAADMDLAFLAFDVGDLEHAGQLLERYRPGSPAGATGWSAKEDLRGWEWRHLWARCRSQETLRLGTHPAAVWALGVSPDGRQLVSGDGRGGIKLWEVSGQRRLIATNAAPGGVEDLAFSPSGTEVTAVTWLGSVHLWNTLSNSWVNLGPQDQGAYQARYSTDGDLLATAYTNEVVLWDRQTRQPRQHIALQDHARPVALAFSPDNYLLAIGDVTGRCTLWDWRADHVLEAWQAWPQAATLEDVRLLLNFSPDGKLMATATAYTSSVQIWGLPGHTNLVELATGDDAIAAPRFSPDGRTLLTCTKDQAVQVWDVTALPAARLMETWPGPAGGAIRGAVTPAGDACASTSLDGKVQFWDRQAASAGLRAALLPPEVQGIIIPSDPAVLVLITPRGGWRTWDSRTLHETRRGTFAQKMPARSFRGLPLGNVVEYSPEKFLQFRQVSDGRVEPFLAYDFGTGDTLTMELSDTGRVLAASGNGRIAVWEVPSKRLLFAQEDSGPPGRRLLRIAHDDTFVACLAQSGEVSLIDLHSGDWVAFPGHIGGGMGLALAPNGRFFATAGDLSKVKVYDVLRRREITSFEPGIGRLMALAFSHDSTRLAASGSTGYLRLWDLGTFREVAWLRAHRDAVRVLGFSDNDTLVTATSDEVHAFQAPSLQGIDRAR